MDEITRAANAVHVTCRTAWRAIRPGGPLDAYTGIARCDSCGEVTQRLTLRALREMGQHCPCGGSLLITTGTIQPIEQDRSL